VLISIVSRNQGGMDKKISLSCISQRSLMSPAQGKVTQVKIMLIPSILNQDKERLKEESSWQDQTYSFVFYLSLEYRSSYYKEGCNMMILTKPKCLKPREIPRVVKGNEISKCTKISRSGQTIFAYRLDQLDLFPNKSSPPDLFDPFTEFQRGFLNMSRP
jgi:hypothetical protein